MMMTMMKIVLSTLSNVTHSKM